MQDYQTLSLIGNITASTKAWKLQTTQNIKRERKVLKLPCSTSNFWENVNKGLRYMEIRRAQQVKATLLRCIDFVQAEARYKW